MEPSPALARPRLPRWCVRRTSLCFHHSSPSHRRDCCLYAHSLSELRYPDESQWRLEEWGDYTVDRFFGQAMSAEQLALIGSYWDAYPWERPVWAVALFLLTRREEARLGYAYTWDFGLVLDVELLILHRNHDDQAGSVPFRWYPGLWSRLGERRRCMDIALHDGTLLQRQPYCLREVSWCATMATDSTIAAGLRDMVVSISPPADADDDDALVDGGALTMASGFGDVSSTIAAGSGGSAAPPPPAAWFDPDEVDWL